MSDQGNEDIQKAIDHDQLARTALAKSNPGDQIEKLLHQTVIKL